MQYVANWDRCTQAHDQEIQRWQTGSQRKIDHGRPIKTEETESQCSESV